MADKALDDLITETEKDILELLKDDDFIKKHRKEIDEINKALDGKYFVYFPDGTGGH